MRDQPEGKPLFRQRAMRVRKGAAAVEFALVAPVFLVLVFGIFEFGRGLMVSQVLTNTARAACRKAILPGVSTSTIQSLAAETLTASGIQGATTTVYVNGVVADAASAQSNDTITLSISVPVSQISIVPVGYLAGNLTAKWTLRRV